MLSFEEVKARTDAELARCVEIINRIHKQNFTSPTVKYYHRGRVAGRASNYQWKMELHATLLAMNPDELEPTVGHEFAHLVDGKLYPENREFGIHQTRSGRFRRDKRSIHGTTWKSIMLTLGHPPERLHSMDTSSVRVKQVKRYEYKCAFCNKVGLLGPKHHKAILQGRAVWFKTCGESHPIRKEGLIRVVVPERKQIVIPGVPNVRPDPTTQTKLERVVEIVRTHSARMPRSQILTIIMDKVGMTKAGASTYYQTARKQIELERRAG